MHQSGIDAFVPDDAKLQQLLDLVTGLLQGSGLLGNSSAGAHFVRMTRAGDILLSAPVGALPEHPNELPHRVSQCASDLKKHKDIRTFRTRYESDNCTVAALRVGDECWAYGANGISYSEAFGILLFFAVFSGADGESLLAELGQENMKEDARAIVDMYGVLTAGMHSVAPRISSDW